MDQELPLLPLPLSQRLSVRQWIVVDVVVATLLAALAIAGTAAGLDGTVHHGAVVQVLRYGLIVAACAALPYRRLHPNAVLAVITAGMTGLVLVGSRGPMILAVILAVYSLASVAPPQASLRATAAVTVAIFVAPLAATGHPSLAAPPLIVVGWLAGENTRTRRAYIAGVTEWAAERDRQREDRSRRAVADERLRIARELHDVVAHTMSVVAVRSSVARVVVDSQPDEARKALEIIEVVSRRAMHEMRLLVGVLRDGEGAKDLAPAPGLADLPGLVAEIGAAGVAVTVHVQGPERALPAGVDVSAFRIIQEALTNVVRHARPAEARLDLRYRRDEVEIEVSDNGGGRHRRLPYPPYPSPALAATAPALAGAAGRPPLSNGNGGGPGASGATAAIARPSAAVGPDHGGRSAAATASATASATAAAGPGVDLASGCGHGLVGMRERVALFGGTFSSGPDGTGYRVRATLPTDEGDPGRT